MHFYIQFVVICRQIVFGLSIMTLAESWKLRLKNGAIKAAPSWLNGCQHVLKGIASKSPKKIVQNSEAHNWSLFKSKHQFRIQCINENTFLVQAQYQNRNSKFGSNFWPIPKLTETVKLKSVIFLHIMSNTKPFFSIPLISIMSISYKFTKFEVKEIKKRSE